MAKKGDKKTTKTTAVKKKSPAVKKHKIAVKKSPFKSKLGHDPLSWITGEDASEFGISFDDIDAKVRSAVDIADGVAKDIEQDQISTLSHQETEVAAEVNTVTEKTVNVAADDGWGLFDDEPLITESPAVQANDASWGLFEDEKATEKSLPVGEGVAWGLFAENTPEDTSIDAEALTILLPAAFNVANINKVYHEFEEVIHKEIDIVVDAKEVETMDATGLQLLYVAQRELQKRSCKLVVKDASEKIELLSTSSFINNVLDIAG
ncbi:MAG: STAS domain-containing protein [Gammaproteobacteria bacterium]|nr:STAS domain-containing protein [Gammaproteobacteria bacterium]